MVEMDVGAPVCLIRGGQEGLRVAEEGVRCVASYELADGKAVDVARPIV